MSSFANPLLPDDAADFGPSDPEVLARIRRNR